jgi:CHAD domain-containing protein
VGRKLDRVLRDFKGSDSPQERRAWCWAVDARVSRRAVDLRAAIDDAAGVYLHERLHRVRIAAKKLRYALELQAEGAGLKSTPELRTLKRLQELLGRLHDLQVLIDRVRHVQADLTPPDVGAWRDLDSLIIALDQSCRRLHARYVGERGAILDICDRLSKRGAPSRRVQRHPRAV